jgi:dTDP-4-dehydrorhamnose reductase
VNADGPERLALACAEVGVPLVHISTDYVFGDQLRRGPGPYTERARHGPVQAYGASKARGEKLVLAQGWYVTVVRVSWLFGPDADPFGTFVLAQVDDARRVAVLKAQRSRPTWVPDLARWLLDVGAALEEDAAGTTDARSLPRVPPVLHPTGGPAADRGEWARAVLDARGLHEVRVDDQGTPPTLAATRPTDSRLDGQRTAQWCDARGISHILDWREGVRRIHRS